MMEPEFEIRNLRFVTIKNGKALYLNFDGDEFRCPHGVYAELGRPTYIVVTVRAETMSESTQ